MKWAPAALGLALLGCAGSPEGGGGTPPSFTSINKEIFEPNCTFACHSGGEFAAGGLDMKANPYGSLVGVRAVAAVCKNSPMLRVVPDKPEDSLVYVKVETKIEGEVAPCGDGMPAGVERAAITDVQADAIRRWIEGGALDD